jgi:hypothetical protein
LLQWAFREAPEAAKSSALSIAAMMDENQDLFPRGPNPSWLRLIPATAGDHEVLASLLDQFQNLPRATEREEWAKRYTVQPQSQSPQKIDGRKTYSSYTGAANPRLWSKSAQFAFDPRRLFVSESCPICQREE